jgi:hypothetical protein
MTSSGIRWCDDEIDDNIIKECPWSSSKRQQTKLSLKLRRRLRRQSAIDKKNWIAKSTNKIEEDQEDKVP